MDVNQKIFLRRLSIVGKIYSGSKFVYDEFFGKSQKADDMYKTLQPLLLPTY